MTEAEWHICTSPERILQLLGKKASPRKLRLYAVECCRRIWSLFLDDRLRQAVDVARRYADGKSTANELLAAGQSVLSIARVFGDPLQPTSRSTHDIGGAAWAATRPDAWIAAWDAAYDARWAAVNDGRRKTDWEQERAWQAQLLKELFGNPFRSIYIDPSWRSPDSPATLLARVIYHEERYGDMPYLGDALEDVGCSDQTILDHCRGPGPHYRGCWVLDAVLGYH
ncbi:MAG: putative immunity protein [Gemmataceae bacterium]